MARASQPTTHPPLTAAWCWPVLCFVVLTAALALRVPPGQAPDENAHLEYVAHLGTYSAFPVFPRGGAAQAGYEFHQPPLYYLLCVPLWRVLPSSIKPYGCRLVSLLAGVATLLVLWQVLIRLFPAEPALAAGGLWFAALWPLHQGVSASAGNDSLAGLMGALIFGVLACGVSHEWTPKLLRITGLVLGLSLLTKNTLLPLVALTPVVILVTHQRVSSWGRAVGAVMATMVIAGLVGGWWLVRNQMLYGDPLANQVFETAFAHSSARPEALMAGLQLSWTRYLHAWAAVLFCTFWGFFGGPNTAIKLWNPFGQMGPRPEALPFGWLMLVLAAAGLLALVGWMRARRVSLFPEVQTILPVWGAGLGLVVLSYLYFNTRFVAGMQARYLHPALLPLVVFFVLGWRLAWPGGDKWVRLVVLAGMLVLTLCNLGIWKTLV